MTVILQSDNNTFPYDKFTNVYTTTKQIKDILLVLREIFVEVDNDFHSH